MQRASWTLSLAVLLATSACVAETGDDDAVEIDEGAAETDESVIDVDQREADVDPLAVGSTIPGDVTCDGSLCWDQEWAACGGYNYRGRVYFSRRSGQIFPHYASVHQYTGDRFDTVNGLDWQIWLKNDDRTIGATTYHNDDDGFIGFMNLSNFDPPRATHPFVEFLAGKSQDGKASCRFRIYLYMGG